MGRNSENLKKGKSTQFKTGREAAEAGRRGGIASGRAKREKKAMRELAKIMLDSKASGGAEKMARQFGADLKDRDVTNAAAVIAGQMVAALKGNTQAARWLSDLVGEMAPQEAEEDELSKALEELGKRL